jgi:hypothetical protein
MRKRKYDNSTKKYTTHIKEMIFGFRSAAVAPQISNISSVDHGRLIDVSLMKLSRLQSMGKSRTERQIVFVLDVLQRALYMKAKEDCGDGKIRNFPRIYCLFLCIV